MNMQKEKQLVYGSAMLLVLSLLESGDRYGYEMITDLELRSNKTFTLQEGTLYPILHGLEKEGMIESYYKAAGERRNRKYYHITKQGLAMLAEKKAEWRHFSAAVEKVIGGDGYAFA